MTEPNIKLTIVVKGGRVFGVYANSTKVDVDIIDKDTEDMDEWKEAANREYDLTHDSKYFKII